MNAPDAISHLNAALEGRYAVEREIGEGGMATVYLADDLKHGRKVALKVLKPELAAVVGAERFLAEIKTTANLQHPHILPLFDSGEADSFLFYVMPYVEGETLRELVDRDKQLPIDDAVDIGRAIAEALDYAHRQDVIHRDIKPENILLHDGSPLVADFGIALAVSEAGSGRLTETGLSLGTPYYMSPEQATAERELSARSDVYSLGCVVYEMLTGAPPHTGPTAQSVLVRILTEDPRDVTEVRQATPEHVAAAVAKAIQRLPADRFGTAREFADALTTPGLAHRPARGARSASRNRSSGWIGAYVVAALAAGVFIGGAVAPRGSAPTATDGSIHLTLDHPLERLAGMEEIVVSPDGRRLALGGRGADGIGIYVRELGEDDFHFVTGTESGLLPAFSPDGTQLVFTHLQTRTLRTIPYAGGVSHSLDPDFTRDVVFSAQWTDRGTIIASDGTSGLYEIPEAGGTLEHVVDVRIPLHQPTALPDGERYIATDVQNRQIVLLQRGSSEIVTLIPNAVSARVMSSGHVIYVDPAGRLWGQAFDASRGSVEGQPVPMLEGLTVFSGATALYSISDNGTLVYNTGGGNEAAGLYERLIEKYFDGRQETLPLPPRQYGQVRWSPDGSRLAFSAFEPRQLVGTSAIYLYDVTLRTATRRLTQSGIFGWPVWSPDGTQLAAAGREDQPTGMTGLSSLTDADLWVLDADGEDPPRVVLEASGTQYPYSWGPDGAVLFTTGSSNSSDLRTVAPYREGALATYLDVDRDLGASAISPDGRYVAMASNELGGYEVFVRTYPEPGQPVQVSENGGDRPTWSTDGEALFYWKRSSAVDSLMKVTLSGTPPSVARREVVYTGRLLGAAWDLHPDGDRIVIAEPEGSDEGSEEVEFEATDRVIINFLDEFRARMEGAGMSSPR